MRVLSSLSPISTGSAALLNWLIALAAIGMAGCGGSDSGPPQPNQIFVSAQGTATGTGTRNAPYGSLAAAQTNSKPGDVIVVLASPPGVAPLDGGIVLQSGQQLLGDGPDVTGTPSQSALPSITNTTAANSGDAVTLADGVTVANLVIANTVRGAIYGHNVATASIKGNDISFANTSCAQGFIAYFPTTQTQINGWAAVMVDTDTGSSSLSIVGNRIHDSNCSDGIDLRATNSAVVTAKVDGNELTRLAQGAAPFTSLLAIGVQTRDTAQMTVSSDSNSQTYLGNAGANCEGLFTNQTGGSVTWTITNNVFAHGAGGSSCNGAEFFAGSGPSNSDVTISHSSFVDDAGDMIEQNNLGSGTMSLKLDHVTVSHTSLATKKANLAPIPPLSFGSFTGQGYCLSIFTSGPGATSRVSVVDSELSDCEGDGINAFFANVAGFGTGAGNEISIDIQRSSITSSRQYALRWWNFSQLNKLSITSSNSLFSGALGQATLGFYAVAGSSTSAQTIDFGGGGAQGSGGNCILRTGSTFVVETQGYPVAAENNWWGAQAGPLAATVSLLGGGSLSAAPALQVIPAGCGYDPLN